MLENSQPVLNSPKRSAQHQQQCKRACSPTWLSFFIAAAAFLILAGAAVGIAFVTKAADDESFRNTFNRYAISQTQRIRNSLSTIEQKLSVVAEALEALPSRGLTRERVFGILATGGAVPGKHCLSRSMLWVPPAANLFPRASQYYLQKLRSSGFD